VSVPALNILTPPLNQDRSFVPSSTKVKPDRSNELSPFRASALIKFTPLSVKGNGQPIDELGVFVTREAEVDEPFTVEHPSRILQQCNPPTQICEGSKRIRITAAARRAGFSYAEPFPAKPKGMHWKTYRRLRSA
jgi:hypothetical protein